MNACFIAFQSSAKRPFGFPIRVFWSSPSGEIINRLIRPDPSWKGWDQKYVAAVTVEPLAEVDLYSAGDSCLDVMNWLNRELREQTVFALDSLDTRHCLKLLSTAGERQPEFLLHKLPPDCQKVDEQETVPEKQISALMNWWTKKNPKEESRTNTNVAYINCTPTEPYLPMKESCEIDFIDALSEHMKATIDDRYSSLSKEEQLYVALASNRLDLIQAKGETIASALGLIGKEWREQLVERHKCL